MLYTAKFSGKKEEKKTTVDGWAEKRKNGKKDDPRVYEMVNIGYGWTLMIFSTEMMRPNGYHPVAYGYYFRIVFFVILEKLYLITFKKKRGNK